VTFLFARTAIADASKHFGEHQADDQQRHQRFVQVDGG
jgi:hypothetical protein